jgi:glycosyltransferase involved in cell wall biosynthesis
VAVRRGRAGNLHEAAAGTFEGRGFGTEDVKSRDLRIGLNALYLVPGKVGGTEVYARRLIEAMATAQPGWEWIVYCGRDAAASLAGEAWPGNTRIVSSLRPSADKVSRLALEQLWLPLRARRDRVDLLHSLGTTTPVRAPLPRVVTIHDLIYLHFPETFPRAASLVLRGTVGAGARAAQRVIADSAAGRDDIVANLGVPAARVDVAYLGFNLRRTPAAPERRVRDELRLADSRVVLCVSAALAHKNLDRLIVGFAQVARTRPDLMLVLAGHAGREQARLSALAAAEGVADRVRLTGWVADDALEGLYDLAACCVYPSLHEGFGLPVLEALGRNVPLACSDATALPEVAGDAAEMFDPLDTAAIGAAIDRLLDGGALVEQRRQLGRERVSRFTWEACARSTIQSYLAALEQPGAGELSPAGRSAHRPPEEPG